jgi:hypothetical protein
MLVFVIISMCVSTRFFSPQMLTQAATAALVDANRTHSAALHDERTAHAAHIESIASKHSQELAALVASHSDTVTALRARHVAHSARFRHVRASRSIHRSNAWLWRERCWAQRDVTQRLRFALAEAREARNATAAQLRALNRALNTVAASSSSAAGAGFDSQSSSISSEAQRGGRLAASDAHSNGSDDDEARAIAAQFALDVERDREIGLIVDVGTPRGDEGDGSPTPQPDDDTEYALVDAAGVPLPSEVEDDEEWEEEEEREDGGDGVGDKRPAPMSAASAAVPPPRLGAGIGGHDDDDDAFGRQLHELQFEHDRRIGGGGQIGASFASPAFTNAAASTLSSASFLSDADRASGRGDPLLGATSSDIGSPAHQYPQQQSPSAASDGGAEEMVVFFDDAQGIEVQMTLSEARELGLIADNYAEDEDDQDDRAVDDADSGASVGVGSRALPLISDERSRQNAALIHRDADASLSFTESEHEREHEHEHGELHRRLHQLALVRSMSDEQPSPLRVSSAATAAVSASVVASDVDSALDRSLKLSSLDMLDVVQAAVASAEHGNDNSRARISLTSSSLSSSSSASSSASSSSSSSASALDAVPSAFLVVDPADGRTSEISWHEARARNLFALSVPIAPSPSVQWAASTAAPATAFSHHHQPHHESQQQIRQQQSDSLPSEIGSQMSAFAAKTALSTVEVDSVRVSSTLPASSSMTLASSAPAPAPSSASFPIAADDAPHTPVRSPIRAHRAERSNQV